MKTSEPPRLSTSLLVRLAPRHRRESLVGDLLEQLRQGRSVWWFRRQVLATILVGLAADVAAHKLLAVRALALGWSAMLVVYLLIGPLIQETRMTLFRRWGSVLWGDSEILRQLWVYYGLPFQLVVCLILMAIGWLVAGLHRRRVPGIVIVFAATLLIPATFQALEIRRLLETELWPGWGWGSFRWALLYQAMLALVAYPLCILIGGLCTARSDGDALVEGPSS
ncbi:MAG TPA: hypothetical protein VFB92_26755 [Vicinamibacterales bacterium]|nr:hypothetical protein [Vicinamibacterales bacterium]